MADIYVSFLESDRELAEHLRAGLQHHGFACRMQLTTGTPEVMLADFREALATVSVIIAVVTRDCLGDPLAGFAAATEGWSGAVLPVLVDGVRPDELPEPLRIRQTFRFDEPDAVVAALRQLCRPIAAAQSRDAPSQGAPALPTLPAAADGPTRAGASLGRLGEGFEQRRRGFANVGSAERAQQAGAVNDPLSIEQLAWLSDQRQGSAAPAPQSQPVPPPADERPMHVPKFEPPKPAAPPSGAGAMRPMPPPLPSPAAPAAPAAPPARVPAAGGPALEGALGDLADRAARERSAAKEASLPPQQRQQQQQQQQQYPASPPPRASARPADIRAPMPRSGSVPGASKGGGFGPGLVALMVAAVLGGVIAGTSAGQGVIAKLLAALGLKLNAFGMFGFRPRGPEPAAPAADLVDCSVFAPAAAPPGATVLVQVFLHTAKQAERAQFMATVMDAATSFKGVQTLQTEIARGARVTVSLSSAGLAVDEPQQTIVWRGEPVFAQFLVTLPAGIDATSFHAVVRIAVDGGLVGRIVFALSADAKAAGRQSVPTGSSARRYEHAFLSYASADRKEVLKRAQVLRAAGVGFFQDILTLDPGARWEREIYRNIDGCDLFLLFWSKAARDSEWVIREAEYALARADKDELPDIVPVILEGPPVIHPPESLKALHFNDQINYLIALS